MSDWVTLSKLLPQFVYPTKFVLWLLLLAFVLLLFRRRTGAGISLFLALLVIFIGSSPITSELYRRHEQQYLPVLVKESPTADAIVLLGGELQLPAPPRVESQLGGNRAVHTMRLYQAGKAPLIIVSGGNVFPQEGLQSESVYTVELLEEWGIPRNAILVEENSRSTRENAVETAKLLRERNLDRVLLVTSAFHMPRALATFRTAGVSAIPSPSSISANLTHPQILDWIPSLEGLGGLKNVIHEKLGILVYRSRGWIE